MSPATSNKNGYIAVPTWVAGIATVLITTLLGFGASWIRDVSSTQDNLLEQVTIISTQLSSQKTTLSTARAAQKDLIVRLENRMDRIDGRLTRIEAKVN